MTIDRERWDLELARIERTTAQKMAEAPTPRIFGVAVDDDEKARYFVSRIQRMLNEHRWPITIRVMTVAGGLRVANDLKAENHDN